MAFHVRDEATDRAVQRLAKLKGKGLTATIREAVAHELKRERAALPLIERLKPIQQQLKSLSQPGGLPADKAFYDKFSGEP